jgi:hypothetical protein
VRSANCEIKTHPGKGGKSKEPQERREGYQRKEQKKKKRTEKKTEADLWNLKSPDELFQGVIPRHHRETCLDKLLRVQRPVVIPDGKSKKERELGKSQRPRNNSCLHEAVSYANAHRHFPIGVGNATPAV